MALDRRRRAWAAPRGRVSAGPPQRAQSAARVWRGGYAAGERGAWKSNRACACGASRQPDVSVLVLVTQARWRSPMCILAARCHAHGTLPVLASPRQAVQRARAQPAGARGTWLSGSACVRSGALSRGDARIGVAASVSKSCTPRCTGVNPKHKRVLNLKQGK